MMPQVTEEPQAEDLKAIRQAALDYAQGWYEGDVDRMRRSLHPELAKRRVLRDPQTGEEGFRHVTRQRMLDLTQQGGGSEEVPSNKRTYGVTILDVCGDIASVRADTTQYVDFLHLARSQGRWLIVNVLYLLKDAPASMSGDPS